jgi:type I restriction enzyme S subunit
VIAENATWEIVRLGEVAEFVRGINFKPDDVLPQGTPGTVICLRTKNIQEELDLTDVWSVGEQFVRRDNQFLRPGDILVSSANSWNLVGKCCWIPALSIRASFGGFVSVLRSIGEKVDPRFLFRWFSSSRIQTLLRSFGQQTTNISNLNISRSLNLQFLLPPLDEQRRITRILDQAEKLQSQRSRSISKLEDLGWSLFFDLFGDPLANPKGLKKVPLGDLISLKSGEFLPASEMSELGTFPVFGGNGINGYHNEYRFDNPQIIIGRVGVYCGCVHVSPPKSWITDNALYVSKQAAGLEFCYLAFALRQARLNQYASQSGQPLISGSRVYPVKILVPSVEDQREFARRMALVENQQASHQASLVKLRSLFASLQNSAFGERS